MLSVPQPTQGSRSQRNLALALGISFLLHGFLLMVHFTYPDALTHVTERALDVVLVNAKHSERPEQAQVKAQASLNGGGNLEQDHRATTPLPPSPQTKAGDDLVAAERRVAELEAQQRQLMTQLKSKKPITSGDKQIEPLPKDDQMTGFDLANRALATIRLEAEIDRNFDAYNKRPRKKVVGSQADSVVEAQYIEDWRLKVERVGNLNYPDAARGRIYGSVSVYVEIDQEGTLVTAELRRPSGSKVLDEAALRILRLAAPFGKFSPEMRREMGVLGFSRTISFTQADQLSTSNK